MSSGTISDILMLMKKGALSALEITLFKAGRGCFMKSVLHCCNPCKTSSFALDNEVTVCGLLSSIECLLITWC